MSKLNKNPLKEEEKFDELIIDEAQDICRIDFFLIFDKILKGGLKKGKIRMFGDFKEQQILPDRKSFKSILNKFGIHDFAEVLISTNCRNREQVGKRVANYCEIKSPYKKFLRDGGQAPQPRFFSNKEDEIKEIHKVLDELRPFLIADGGNVEIVEIDGPVVKVRLQGACGSCPSSTMTLKMGIERKLREMIPEVSEVIQVL